MLKRLYVSLLLLVCLLQGCRGPDSISITFGEQKLLPYDIAWRGASASLTWTFDKEKK